MSVSEENDGKEMRIAHANDSSDHSRDCGDRFEEDSTVENLVFCNRSNVPHGA